MGRSRKSRHQERVGRLLLECGISDYRAGLEPEADNDTGPAVMTIAAPRIRTTCGGAKTAQMLLWDQPVTVATSVGAGALPAPPPPAVPAEQHEPEAATDLSHTTMTVRLSRETDPETRFTLAGLLKGCAIGMSAAAALLLIYMLIH